MRILTTFLLLLATVLPSWAATTYPAGTNTPNIFFQTNTFLTNTYFGLPRTNVIGSDGSAINGVGFTNRDIVARNINSITNFDTRVWTNVTGVLRIGTPGGLGDVYLWNDGDNQYRRINTGIGEIIAMEANLSVTGSVSAAGGTMSAPLLTTSSTSNAPSSLELASAGWVRSLFNNGVLDYATTNIDATATNVGSGQPMYTFASAIPTSNSRTYTAPNAGDYIGSVMTTNRFTFLQGPIEVNAYLAGAGGVGSPSISVHPEIYYSYDKTNWYGDWDSQNQTVAIGSTNLYQFVISFPAVTATNSAGFYIQRRFKVGTATGATHPNLIFLIGTNIASGVANASHISFSGPNSGYGNAYLAANQTWTGTNTFNGPSFFSGDVSFDQLNVNTIVVTNPPVLNLSSSTNLPATNLVNRAVYSTNSYNGVAIDATKSYQWFVTNASFGVSGFTGVLPNSQHVFSMTVSNSDASAITWSGPPTSFYIGAVSTNALSIAAGKVGVISFWLYPGRTNICNAVQQ